MSPPPDRSPSWVPLVATALPLVRVAASWSRVLDPAHYLMAETPVAVLPLLLRRTLVVLLVAVPATLLAGVVTREGDRSVADAVPWPDGGGARAGRGD